MHDIHLNRSGVSSHVVAVFHTIDDCRAFTDTCRMLILLRSGRDRYLRFDRKRVGQKIIWE